MLALVLVGLIVLAASAANAREDSSSLSGFVQSTPRIVMPVDNPIGERPWRKEPLPLLGAVHGQSTRSHEPETPTLSFGPLSADLQPPMTGRRHGHRISRVHVDGMALLGASVSGAVSGHGGSVTLVWPVFGP